MTTTNIELAAALATVPEIERMEKLLDDAKKRLRDHPQGTSPDVARDEVINAAVAGFQADGTWPTDIGKQAAKAHADAAAWEAERLARKRAVDSTELLAYDTRQALASDALEHLGTRLDEVLSDARTAAETLGDVQSADAAIKAGGAVVEAWGRLQGLVGHLANIRAAQWALLDPGPRPRSAVSDRDTDERRSLRKWRREGYGEVRGRLDDVPTFVQDATRSGEYSETVLLWLTGVETAYVPTSFEDLRDDANVGALIDVTTGADGPIDLSPTVLPPLTPKPAEVYAHSRTPHMDHSQPTPARPTPNATAPDRERSTTDYF
ncbi:hypothetical protein ACFYWX_10665 [Streptomyces sp. NPDC002888]|uniref:hypothetical protein n=1 Tax=Streptomyces sp. NPDC002888 TaxID=3364668 RepID=UPI0036C82DFD